jgi:hypothetical protein
MNEEPPHPGVTERAADTVTDIARTGEEISEALTAAIHRLTDTLESARRPGQPLAHLSKITREAPLGAIFVAFLLGVAVARRR